MKKKNQAAKLKSPDDLPVTPALEELAFVRKAFHDVMAHYAARIEGDLNAIREAVAMIAGQRKVSEDRVSGLRDVLLILREVEVKPEKGRRRDIKRIESAVAEMRRIADAWD